MNTTTTIIAAPVTMREVGLREALQMLPRMRASAHRLEPIGGAHAAGRPKTVAA